MSSKVRLAVWCGASYKFLQPDGSLTDCRQTAVLFENKEVGHAVGEENFTIVGANYLLETQYETGRTEEGSITN